MFFKILGLGRGGGTKLQKLFPMALRSHFVNEPRLMCKFDNLVVPAIRFISDRFSPRKRSEDSKTLQDQAHNFGTLRTKHALPTPPEGPRPCGKKIYDMFNKNTFCIRTMILWIACFSENGLELLGRVRYIAWEQHTCAPSGWG
eukprot:4739712-Amphidinium_carterae.1